MVDAWHIRGEVSSRNPCKPGCPDREGGCHASCEKYLEFERWKTDVYANRQKYYGAHGWSAGAVARAKRNEAAKRGNRRHYK